MALICIIDDQALLRDSLQATLTGQDHKVVAFDNAQDALTTIRQQSFDAVITDLRLPGMDGVSLLREMRRLGIDVPVVLMTAYASVATAVEAMKLGAFDYIQKPFNADEVAITIERAVRERNMMRDNEVMKRTIEDQERDRRLIGESAAMRAVMEKIQRVAQSSATVLITGESGVGKEVIARAIHAASARADQPMLCVNCAALSPTLLESELFGHEKGAFTGADRVRKGRFELADGGTLLLDEVSEIPPPLQAKLLRVLQEREFERVGSSVTRRVDVRVIATTNRDLRDWAAKARFREDLYYRLSVLPVEVPPLRARREDISRLLDAFVERACKRDGREKPTFPRDTIEVLCDYRWPGNVRELENLCERVCVLEAGKSVAPDTVRPLLNGLLKVASAPVEEIRYRDGQILSDAEFELIMKTLNRFSGHREKTARALGIGLRTLGLKLKKWREDGVIAPESRIGQPGRLRGLHALPSLPHIDGGLGVSLGGAGIGGAGISGGAGLGSGITSAVGAAPAGI
ncbi:Transcriptional regulatory protein ZraR [Phycisphaerae bacterium RAS1]|nr:Transcriptional regulatory protein ZraR [Phycisphaerae bacterium RAS1]